MDRDKDVGNGCVPALEDGHPQSGLLQPVSEAVQPCVAGDGEYSQNQVEHCPPESPEREADQPRDYSFSSLLMSGTLSIFSQEKEPSSPGILPKCPKEAVFLKIGRRRPRQSMMS